MSHDVQNEMLKMMALNVLRKINANLHTAEYYSIMLDESTDVANREQVQN